MRAGAGSRAATLSAVLALLAAAAGAQAGSGAPAFSGAVTGSLAAWEDRGSPLAAAGIAPAWQGIVAGEARVEAGEVSRCVAEGGLELDLSAGTVAFSLRELWAGWSSGPLSLRAGRQRLGFGSGLAWNPSNDLDPRRNAADPGATRSGTDALMLRIEGGGLAGFPLSLAAEAFLPAWSAGKELSDLRCAAQAYGYLGGLELMLVGSLGRASAPGEAWLAGFWTTAELGRLVLGLEGALRRRSDRLLPGAGGAPEASAGLFRAATATASLRAGDFAAAAELLWDEGAYSREELDAILASPARSAWGAALAAPGAAGAFHLFGRLSWSPGDLGLSASLLLDPETLSWLAAGELSWAADGRSLLRLRASLPSPAPPSPRDELELSPRGAQLRASLAVSY